MKNKTIFVCSNCQYQTAKWMGKCPNCKEWNTLQKKEEQNLETKNLIETQAKLELFNLAELEERMKSKQKRSHLLFTNKILGNFWNKGLVSGSLTLLAGEPGLGKSTLALQLLKSLYNSKTSDPQNYIYLTAEESIFEVARRSQRLKIPKQVKILQSNSFEKIASLMKKESPDILIFDSIQTVFMEQLPSSPGSVTQVTYIANQLLSLSKTLNIAIIIIGHVTKEGQIAGPKTLEHLVDSVLMLERSKNSNYRTLSFSKHRYGSVDNQLLLKMEETGLQIITDPSLALLENLEKGVGVVYGIGMDKNLPLIVEIQALVSSPNFSGSFGRREALGFKTSKLNTILAIAEKYLGLDLKGRDVYLQLTGIPKNLEDDSLDLPILLAILSSLQSQEVEKILKLRPKTKNLFAGRLTLSGKLRKATKLDLRQKTASSLNFDLNPGTKEGSINQLIE